MHAFTNILNAKMIRDLKMRLTVTVSVGYRQNKRERYIDRARERERERHRSAISPSAVPCTRRYSTDLKFLALPVTVEFCKTRSIP